MPAKARPRNDRLLTKEEYVGRYVRDAIVAGRLQPGDRLRQQELADQLDMSPTPVREALRGLVTEGWLELRPHVGVSVAEVDHSSADEVYRLREMIEGRLAAEAASRITPAELKDVRELNADCKRAAFKGDHALAREANFMFHRSIWEAAKWPVAAGILDALWAQAPWSTIGNSRAREKRSYEEHTRVVNALAAGDGAKARAALAAHVRSGRADYHKAIDGIIPTDED